MNTLIIFLQLIIAFGLINVWLVRFNKATQYRGGSAKNMEEEFAAYGLPLWLMYAVGSLKIFIAAMLLISFWILIKPVESYTELAGNLLFYNLIVLAVLMVAALIMHVKIKDPIKKSYPALSILFMTALIMYFTFG
tara:strand:- start:686 stop:1093 length:408 start_codon:yes stop_codon:yes gene_type:complete